jgi:formylmethanofuran--tetrahydromethanopterin N-formyltransferase
VCGYGTSVIGCDAEAGVESVLSPQQTPDGRPGASLLFFAFNAKALGKALPNRVGQCLMTCPTTAVYDGIPGVPGVPGAGVQPSDDAARIDVGKTLRYFGDGHQKSKAVNGRRYWRVPVMDGEFTVEESVGAVKAIGGGNLLICAGGQRAALSAAMRAVDAIAPLPDVITPFPGGIVRSGSKVGSRYKALFASTNDEYCPTLRSAAASKLRDGVGAVYEIVINGLSEKAIGRAMRVGIEAACGGGSGVAGEADPGHRNAPGLDPGHRPPGIAPASGGGEVIAISAGNYGGSLGKFHFRLHDVMREAVA